MSINRLSRSQMLTASQCRMARAALEWGVRDLAKKAGISANTVARFENGHHTPNPATLKVIRLAFEEAGIEFTNGEAPGVRLHPRRE
jgi:transcriptional regulator with XRE-family HTH domain